MEEEDTAAPACSSCGGRAEQEGEEGGRKEEEEEKEVGKAVKKFKQKSEVESVLREINTFSSFFSINTEFDETHVNFYNTTKNAPLC